MSIIYTRLFLALTAIRLRAHGVPHELGHDVIRIVDDALAGLNLDTPPERRSPEDFDTVRVDGEPAFEVEVRAIAPPRDEEAKRMRDIKRRTPLHLQRAPRFQTIALPGQSVIPATPDEIAELNAYEDRGGSML